MTGAGPLAERRPARAPAPVPAAAYLRVALDVPLRTSFDYLPPDGVNAAALRPGVRVRVPLGRGHKVGLLLDVSERTEQRPARLRRVEAVLDPEPILAPALLDVIRWAARYYHHPPGEVVAAALPALLRAGGSLGAGEERAWRLSAAGREAPLASMARAPRQAAVLARLRAAGGALSEAQLADVPGDWRAALARLRARALVDPAPLPAPDAQVAAGPVATAAQAQVCAAICAARDRFEPFLLDGVTGSGKTEIYLQAAAAVLERGEQVLVLVPEIGLTDQIVERFRERFGHARVAVVHSGLGDRERLRVWLRAAAGRVAVVIGTRSAVWTPCARLGLLVVDEEHDLAYKQQDGLRYSARDVAVVRARREAVPIVLGSATPALETLHNALAGRYRHLCLPQRASGAAAPRVRLLDIGGQRLDGGLCEALLACTGRHLAAGGQVLLFINRRGYAPVAFCPECGEVGRCRRCDANLVYHKLDACLRCHHCGAERSFERGCPACSHAGVQLIGQGTERLEEVLRARFPGRRIERIDRDSTRRRGTLERKLAAARQGEAQILVGTQMLSKGHHFPGVTLVGVVDADGRLYGADFRAPERLAQLLVQVGGRAGRADRPGEVLVQTRFPSHPLYRELFAAGYGTFARTALAERAQAGLPPFAALALLRAEAGTAAAALGFLERAAAAAGADPCAGVELLGPVPAPMQRRAGHFRAHLLLSAARRAQLGAALERWLPRFERLPEARRARWSLDVDPQELL